MSGTVTGMAVLIALGVLLLVVGLLAALAWRRHEGNPSGDDGVDARGRSTSRASNLDRPQRETPFGTGSGSSPF